MKRRFCALFILSCAAPLVAAEEPKPISVATLQAASERGEAEAQFQLARALLRGEGVPKDVNKAFTLMKAAAEQGHADAIGGVGYFYASGVVVPKDVKVAAEWFRKGAEKGSAKAQMNLGEMLLTGKQPDSQEPDPIRDEGVQWIKKAADQGLADANFRYGKILYFGDYGHAVDYKNASIYLKSAAEKGVAGAQNLVGTIYELALETPMDLAAAESWYRRAAMQGDARAQSNLGSMLGPLVEKRETRIEAVAWLLMAADQNDIAAIKSLEDSVPALKKEEMDEAKKRRDELSKQVGKK